ncbi:MAG: hypothetical protein EBQ92_10765 [Proteobacteria bacterium]|nr:hypothetical protein [Pseudomonadota bacterium]
MKKFFGFLFLLLGVPSFLCGGVMVGEAARNGFRDIGGLVLLIGIPVGLGLDDFFCLSVIKIRSKATATAPGRFSK